MRGACTVCMLCSLPLLKGFVGVGVGDGGWGCCSALALGLAGVLRFESVEG